MYVYTLHRWRYLHNFCVLPILLLFCFRFLLVLFLAKLFANITNCILLLNLITILALFPTYFFSPSASFCVSLALSPFLHSPSTFRLARLPIDSFWPQLFPGTFAHRPKSKYSPFQSSLVFFSPQVDDCKFHQFIHESIWLLKEVCQQMCVFVQQCCLQPV